MSVPNKYLLNNNPNESGQSSYERGHSNKTALSLVKQIILLFHVIKKDQDTHDIYIAPYSAR